VSVASEVNFYLAVAVLGGIVLVFWRFCNLIFLVVVYFIFIPVFCFVILILWTRIVYLAF